MKRPDEIKKALECCFYDSEQCGECPYYPVSCDRELVRDAREYIRQLEAERDAAVADVALFPDCSTCKYDPRKKGYIPNDCDDCIEHCSYKWRGVKKEERQWL